ncbi:MAG: hypothetical protein KGI71_04440, partial [Patescibacteria group bacterium]|nr:hypothetical protein [Patescibacteria group bacterium]
ALDESPDVVGFRLAYTVDGVLDRLPAIHSLRYASWRVTDQAYERTPNHLNPVRRQYARLTLPFQDGFGEDRAYSERLLPHLRREVFLDGDPAYLYRYSPATSLFAAGRRAVIGDEPALAVPAHVRLLHDDSPVHGV